MCTCCCWPRACPGVRADRSESVAATKREQSGGAEVAQSSRGLTLGFSSGHDLGPPRCALAPSCRQVRPEARSSGRPRGWTVCGGAVGAREPQQRGVLSHTHASARARWPPRPAPQALLSGPGPPPRRGRACCLPCFQDVCGGLAATLSGLGLLLDSASCGFPQTRAAAAQPVLAARTAVLTCRPSVRRGVPGTELRSERTCTEVQLRGCPQPSLAEDRGSRRAWGRAGAAGSRPRSG